MASGLASSEPVGRQQVGLLGGHQGASGVTNGETTQEDGGLASRLYIFQLFLPVQYGLTSYIIVIKYISFEISGLTFKCARAT